MYTIRVTISRHHTPDRSSAIHSTLQFWPFYMSRANSINTLCTSVNNTSCNKPKVVPEPEIQAPRGTERQCGVGGTQAAASLQSPSISRTFSRNF